MSRAYEPQDGLDLLLRIPAIVNTWTAHRERSVIGAKRRAPVGAKRRVFSGFPSGG
jgi:hypothetical protein